MNNEYAIPILIVGLVVSLGVGFLVGYGMRDSQFPTNNSSGIVEATKAEQENTRQCYKLLTEALAPKPAADAAAAH